MCGIVGAVAKTPVNQLLYDALTILQHRGQDAAGIVTCDGEHLFLRKGNGLVRDVFHRRHMRRLQGNMGIGHVRYPTAGCTSEAEAQPFYVNSPYGISLGHNGNLTNAEQLRKDLFIKDRRHMNTSSDSELLLNVFANALQAQNKLDLTPEDIFAAVTSVHERCEGAYAAVAMITDYGMVAFRDPLGIRPAVFGYRESEAGREYMVASESVALSTAGYTVERDIAPGEAVYVDTDGKLHTQQCASAPEYKSCIFEYVYLARPDSVIDKVPVHKARLRMGKLLAQKIKRLYPDHDIDVVMPIPDTSRTAAMQLAYHLNVMHREGFIKNRYIGRTFIMPGQSVRKKSVRQKLNPIDMEFRGKNVLLVDDSIVRGTTSKQIIQMARDSGAKKVYFASAAPAVRYQNVYGIDMPAVEELVAHSHPDEEIAELIGADWLVFQDLSDLMLSVSKENPALQTFDCSVFTGEYPTGNITPEYLAQLEQERSDAAKAAIDDDADSDNSLNLNGSL